MRKRRRGLLGDLFETLRCPVCFELRELVNMSGCGHSLCRQCIQLVADEHRKTSASYPSCPLCRERFSVGHSKPNVTLSGAVGVLKGLLCPSASFGCHYIGIEIDEHLRDCPYTPATCIVNRCRCVFDVDAGHVCPHRPCPAGSMCSEKGDEHIANCRIYAYMKRRDQEVAMLHEAIANLNSAVSDQKSLIENRMPEMVKLIAEVERLKRLIEAQESTSQ